jgi:hypothetical protein
MPIEPSLWLLGLTLAIAGPILVRTHARRARDEARQRTDRFLAKALADEAPPQSAPEDTP